LMEQLAYETRPVGVTAFRWTGVPEDIPQAYGWLAGTGSVVGSRVISQGEDAGMVELVISSNKASPGDWLVLRNGSWMIFAEEQFQAGYRRTA
jgi:hypothetical protein